MILDHSDRPRKRGLDETRVALLTKFLSLPCRAHKLFAGKVLRRSSRSTEGFVITSLSPCKNTLCSHSNSVFGFRVQVS